MVFPLSLSTAGGMKIRMLIPMLVASSAKVAGRPFLANGHYPKSHSEPLPRMRLPISTSLCGSRTRRLFQRRSNAHSCSTCVVSCHGCVRAMISQTAPGKVDPPRACDAILLDKNTHSQEKTPQTKHQTKKMYKTPSLNPFMHSIFRCSSCIRRIPGGTRLGAPDKKQKNTTGVH